MRYGTMFRDALLSCVALAADPYRLTCFSHGRMAEYREENAMIQVCCGLLNFANPPSAALSHSADAVVANPNPTLLRLFDFSVIPHSPRRLETCT